MVSLNFDKIVEHMDYLQSTTEYVPLVLQTYTGVDYFDKVDDSVMLEYYSARTGLQGHHIGIGVEHEFTLGAGQEYIVVDRNNKSDPPVVEILLI